MTAYSPTCFGKSRPFRGFTLMEMLIVIVILGILLAIMVPAVQSALRDSRLQQAKATITTMGNARYRTFLLEEFGQIAPNGAGTVFVGATPKAQAQNAAAFYFSAGLVSKLPDTKYVIILGGDMLVDNASL